MLCAQIPTKAVKKVFCFVFFEFVDIKKIIPHTSLWALLLRTHVENFRKKSEVLLELKQKTFFKQKTWFLVNDKPLCKTTCSIFQCRIIIFKQ